MNKLKVLQTIARRALLILNHFAGMLLAKVLCSAYNTLRSYGVPS